MRYFFSCILINVDFMNDIQYNTKCVKFYRMQKHSTATTKLLPSKKKDSVNDKLNSLN